MANVLNSLFGGGKPAADPVKAQTGDNGEYTCANTVWFDW